MVNSNKVKIQFNTLIKYRLGNTRTFSFRDSDNKVDVYKSDELLFSVSLEKFTDEQISNNSAEWKKYKTGLLNEFLPSTITTRSVTVAREVTSAGPSRAVMRKIMRSGGCNCGKK